MTRFHTTALVALVLLSGCGGGETPAANSANDIQMSGNAVEAATPAAAATTAAEAPETKASVNLASDELTVVLDSGAARHVPFGTSKDSTIQILSAALGNPIEQARNEDCGAGALDYANFRGGLSLYFDEGKFAGWDLDGREKGSFATADGVGIGATRKQLEAKGEFSIEESTIGHEFAVGELYGLVDSTKPTGKVTNLWAGTTCIAR